MPLIDDEPPPPPRSKVLFDEDREAEIEMSQQVRALFQRLDIPITSIPLGTQLPWKSFETLLVSHAVRGKAPPPPQRSSDPRRTSLTSPRARELIREKKRHAKQRASATAPGNAHTLTEAGPTSDPRLTTLDDAADAQGNVENGPYDARVHALSLMLVNDSTHVPTIESTLHDMEVAIKRMDGMSLALSQGKPFRPRSETSIEPGVIYDPELRTIAELNRLVDVLRGDIATQAATIRRLENELREKKVLITSLREDLYYYRSKDPFSGDEMDLEGSQRQDKDGHSSHSSSDSDVEEGAMTKAFVRRGTGGPAPSQGSPTFLRKVSSSPPSAAAVDDSEQQRTAEERRSGSVAFVVTPPQPRCDDPEPVHNVEGAPVAAPSSLRSRFQNAVRTIQRRGIGGDEASSSTPETAALRRRRGAPSGAAASVRSRLSHSVVAAFREAVVDTIPRRHAVLGLAAYEALKLAAIFEAKLMSRLIDEQQSSATAGMLLNSGGSFRKPAGSSSAAVTTMSSAASALSAEVVDDDIQRRDAALFFSTAASRLLETPVYPPWRLTPFAPQLYFLAVAIANKACLSHTLESSIWSDASRQTVHYVENVVRKFGGHLVTSENLDVLAVFATLRSAAGCALEIQYDLPNNPDVVWPAGLDLHPLLQSAKDVLNGTNRFVWRGLRLGMYLDVISSGPTTFVRDLCDSGGCIYNGVESRQCLWMAATTAQGGSILLPQRVRETLDALSVELDDPTIAFWSWRFLPGASSAAKVFDCYHRTHSTRRAENQHSLRLMYHPLQMRILTDPTTPATLERLVTLHNQAMAKQGVRPVTRDDESILGLEGTIEARLASLRELPRLMSDEVRPNNESVFLAHVPALPNPTTPEGFEHLPNGDVCVVLVVIPAYEEIVRFVDEALASSTARKVFRVCRELAAKSEFSTVSCIRSKKDRILLASPDVLDAIRFCVVLQDQLFHLSPWPRDGLPPGLQHLLEPKKVRGRVVADGPAVHCSLHVTKVRIAMESFGVDAQPYYVGSELDFLEVMSFNAAECVNSVYVTDTVYAMLSSRESELTFPKPFVEPFGLIDRGNEFRCVYALTPRSLVHRLLLFPSAFILSYRRWLARQRTLGLCPPPLPKLVPQSQVDHAAARFLPPKWTGIERQAMRRYYLSAFRSNDARQLPVAISSLSLSSTITSTKTQAMCAKMYFEGQKRELRMHNMVAIAASVARLRGRREDRRALESFERVVMETHDPCIVPHLRGSLPLDLDFIGLQDLGVGSLSAANAAFVSSHMLAPSGSSTPKSSIVVRSGSTKNLDSGRRPSAIPPPLSLGQGGVVAGQAMPVPPDGLRPQYSPRDDTSASVSARGENHEVRALLGIDKERQFMIQRTKKIEAEVRITHQAVECFIRSFRSYLDPLLSSQAPRVSDEEVILNCMGRINALRDEIKKSSRDSDDDSEDDAPALRAKQLIDEEGSDSSDDDGGEYELSKKERDEQKKQLERVRINERWQDTLASVVELQGGDGDDYDPVLLCRSVVGLICRHFQQLRLVHRRVGRVHEQLERVQRTVDPATKIGKAIETHSEHHILRKRAEEEASRVAASDIIKLGPVECPEEEESALSLRSPAQQQLSHSPLPPS